MLLFLLLRPGSMLDTANGLDLAAVGLAAIVSVLPIFTILSIPFQDILVASVAWILICHPPRKIKQNIGVIGNLTHVPSLEREQHIFS